MRLAFFGTPEAAVPSLEALVSADHDVSIVITRPDRRRGRGSALSGSPVKLAGEHLGLKVAHRLADLDGVDVELGIVVAYGAIIPATVLERLAMLNVHFSLLPRWRGAAPVERAILAGDEETGVSIMSLEVGLDTGPVHLTRRTEVDEKTAGELTSELAQLGARALVEVLASNELLAHRAAQVGEATYADKLTNDTFRLTTEMTRTQLLRTVRLGRAFTFVDGRRLRVERARASDEAGPGPGLITAFGRHVVVGAREGAIELELVQPEGSRPMDAYAWWAGARLDQQRARWGQ